MFRLLPTKLAFSFFRIPSVIRVLFKCLRYSVLSGLILLVLTTEIFSQSLDLPAKKWGLSFGNSTNFTGVRLNFRDRNVERINGINITLWKPYRENRNSVINGLSLGLLPGAGEFRGLQIGILGVGAEKSASGINLGILGAGSGRNLYGLNLGGFGAGAGENLAGINVGGTGLGAGKNATGLNLAGLGVGAGADLTGITLAAGGAGAGANLRGLALLGFGAGAGENISGVAAAGLGAGAGENIKGFVLAGLGAGAGKAIRGMVIAGLGAGAGEKISGVAVAGLGTGAPEVKGALISGIFAGGKNLTGLFLAGGSVRLSREGNLRGLAISSFNYLPGNLKGLSLGLVNYAWKVEKGFQLGLINIIKSNPRVTRVLPVINTSW